MSPEIDSDNPHVIIQSALKKVVNELVGCSLLQTFSEISVLFSLKHEPCLLECYAWLRSVDKEGSWKTYWFSLLFLKLGRIINRKNNTQQRAN